MTEPGWRPRWLPIASRTRGVSARGQSRPRAWQSREVNDLVPESAILGAAGRSDVSDDEDLLAGPDQMQITPGDSSIASGSSRSRRTSCRSLAFSARMRPSSPESAWYSCRAWSTAGSPRAPTRASSANAQATNANANFKSREPRGTGAATWGFGAREGGLGFTEWIEVIGVVQSKSCDMLYRTFGESTSANSQIARDF